MELIPRTPEYQKLDVIYPFSKTVYGPFSSRRLGQVLGINFFHHQKICSFDCPYCELDRTQIRMNQLRKDFLFPLPDELMKEIHLAFLNKNNYDFQKVLISGNGEPTLYPHFSELVPLLIESRNELIPDIPLVVMTNGVHGETRKILNSLNRLDEVMIKVDAGNENVFKRINNPLVRATLSKVIAGAQKLNNVSVQSFFVQGAIDNTLDSMIEEWIEVVGMMRPHKVYLYTLKRVPPITGLIPTDEDKLDTIASKLKRRTQIEVLVFP